MPAVAGALLLQTSVIFVLFCYWAVDPADVGVPGVLLFSFLLSTVFNETVVGTDADDLFLLAFLLTVWRIRYVYPGSRILIFTHTGSRISDPGSKNSNKRER
jgi:hypothetical protein